MKYWIVLILQTVSFVLFAQEKNKENRSYSIGGFYSADYIRGDFDGRSGYSTGLNLMCEISPKIRLDIGLHFSSINARKENLIFGSSLNPNTGTIDTTYTLKQKYQFIELPIKINYFLSKSKRVNTFLIAGILPNYLLKMVTSYETNPSSGEEIKANPFPETYSNNTFGIGGIIGFGLGINITERLTINLQPEYRIYFSSNRLYAMGINSGIILKL